MSEVAFNLMAVEHVLELGTLHVGHNSAPGQVPILPSHGDVWYNVILPTLLNSYCAAAASALRTGANELRWCGVGP